MEFTTNEKKLLKLKKTIPFCKQGNIAIKIMIFPCYSHFDMLEFQLDLIAGRSSL